jgi:hypothetical protein
MANMLTGTFCSDNGPVNVSKAVSVVDKIGFVGIAEEWSLSLCLWHRRFGGRMLSTELKHSRRGIARNETSWHGQYNEHDLLGDWRPDADTMVYEAAVRRFWHEIDAYGIDRELCESESQWLLSR